MLHTNVFGVMVKLVHGFCFGAQYNNFMDFHNKTNVKVSQSYCVREIMIRF